MAGKKKPDGNAFLASLCDPAPPPDDESPPPGCSGEQAVAEAMLKKAMKGDTAAAKFLMDMATRVLDGKRQETAFKLELVVVDDAH